MCICFSKIVFGKLGHKVQHRLIRYYFKYIFSRFLCAFIMLENNLKVSHWKTTSNDEKTGFRKIRKLFALSICKLLTFPTFIQFQCHFENSACSLSQKSPIWKTFYWRSLFQEERWNRVLDGLKRDIFLATTATLAM